MKMIFEWDANKARTIFADPFLITFVDEFHSNEEERLISIGISERHRVLLAVHTEREERDETIIIRIISCRNATSAERKRYEEKEDE